MKERERDENEAPVSKFLVLTKPYGAKYIDVKLYVLEVGAENLVILNSEMYIPSALITHIFIYY